MLQDCFHYTDWDVFRGCGALTCESPDDFTIAVLDYINFCVLKCYNLEADPCVCQPKTVDDLQGQTTN